MKYCDLCDFKDSFSFACQRCLSLDDVSCWSLRKDVSNEELKNLGFFEGWLFDEDSE